MPPDDRIRCTTCAALQHNGLCLAAEQGHLPYAARRYRPDLDVSHRCHGYRPHRDAEDPRTGMERWPWLARLYVARERVEAYREARG